MSPSTGLSGSRLSKNRIALDDPKRAENIDNCAKDEVWGDFIRLPHKNLALATVDINEFL